MKPPMKQKVAAFVPVLGPDGKIIPDRYGRPQTERRESKARVTLKERTIRNSQGVETRISTEIDVPPDFLPDNGLKVEFNDIAGRALSGTIEDKDEAPNLDASKVYYRTLLVSG